MNHAITENYFINQTDKNSLRGFAAGLTILLHGLLLVVLSARDIPMTPSLLADPVLEFAVSTLPATTHHRTPPRAIVPRAISVEPAPTQTRVMPDTPAVAESAPAPAQIPAAAVPPIAQAEPEIATAAQFDSRYTAAPDSAYPARAKRLRQQGVVIVRTTIDASGHIEFAHVLTSSGYTILDEAALAYVRTIPFIPARQGAHAITSQADIPVRFSLY
ncbi:MAG: energy transducer TonB [Pseudomonadota bacterium]